MLNENAPLKNRLDAFDFDRDVSPAFVARLARENGWSRDYAERACAEYKRFVLLSLTAGHPCTPSDQVDQAWHLHLLHTASYWDHFCGEVLERPLHHGPTRGGAAETEKFRAWYERTLASYRACFGEDPPRDIWPPLGERFALSYVRVDRSRHWLVPKRIGGLPVRASLLVALVVALAFVSELVQRASPFDLGGDAFVWFFLKFWVVSLVVVAVLRRVMPKRAAKVSLHPYEVAYLAEGHEAATNAAIASLIDHGSLSLDQASRRFRLVRVKHPFGQAIEGVILDECVQHPDGVGLQSLQHAVRAHEAQLRSDAEHAGLLFTATQRYICWLVALIAPALGAINVLLGFAFDKPFGFALLMTAIAVVVAFAVRDGMHATPAGKAWLERLRADNPLEKNAHGQSQLPEAMPIGLGVALFGVEVLAGTPMADFASLFQVEDSGCCGCD